MTRTSMINRLKEMTGEKDDAALLTYLELAEEIVLQRCYPCHLEKTEIPARYHGKVLEIAAYLLNKRGAEGQTAHNENGINRSYEAAGVPESMLKTIIPFARSLGGAQ